MSDQDYVIDVQHISKSFGSLKAVNDVSLSIKKGEIYGFLGPNGSGKTTMIRMLCGLLTPDAGQGQCLGFDIMKESEAIKIRTGYMTQRYSYYEDLSAVENLEFIAKMYQLDNKEQRIKDMLDRLSFTDKRRHQLTGTLSGGWKQRVALAGSLLHDPELLLLDEPTGGVDPKARREFWDIIHHLSVKGVTTLVSTHYMDEAARCTKLGYIVYSQLMASGTMQEIISSTGLSTWEITGPHLHKLAQTLRDQPGVTDVNFFGVVLHVSGEDTENLKKTMAPYMQDSLYQCAEIQSSLEDVFIHFVGEADIT